ncbi:MAG: DUF3445 domain-containing protein [Maritimibacter sp.]
MQQFREICQRDLPIRPWAEDRTRRLPGLNPVEPGDWLRVDDAYAAQMGYREALLADRPGAVLALDEGARPAAEELLDVVLDEIAGKPGFVRDGDHVTCPDGRVVAIDRAAPLATCGRLVQEDLVLLEMRPGSDEHLLTGAVLCFPASWTLAEKFLKPLTLIHTPVPSYSADLARRVQRLFDGLQVGRPIWRANNLIYGNPDLHQPRSEDDRREDAADGPRWLRVERQCLRRLAESRAVVFSIHSYVVPFESLEVEDQAALA